MIEGWPWVFQLFFLITPFILGFSGQAIVLKMALTRESALITKAFSRSSYVYSKSWMAETGLIGRMFFIFQAAGVLAIPGPGLKSGVVSADDLREFPVCLKRKLIVSLTLVSTAFVWLVIGSQFL